jgi:alcohol dehydrogenase
MMSYAEYMAGMAFNSASLGYVHAMAHQLGGLYDLPHGVCNAILLPHVCRFNLESNPAKFADIAAALGINTKDITITEAAQLAIEAIVKLSRAVGIPAGLSEFDLVNKDDFTLLATNAQADVCNLTNPRRASLEEVIAIYESAY